MLSRDTVIIMLLLMIAGAAQQFFQEAVNQASDQNEKHMIMIHTHTTPQAQMLTGMLTVGPQ